MVKRSSTTNTKHEPKGMPRRRFIGSAAAAVAGLSTFPAHAIRARGPGPNPARDFGSNTLLLWECSRNMPEMTRSIN